MDVTFFRRVGEDVCDGICLMILSCNSTKDSFGATRWACLPAARGDKEEFGLLDGVEDFERCHAAFDSEGESIKSLPDGL